MRATFSLFSAIVFMVWLKSRRDLSADVRKSVGRVDCSLSYNLLFGLIVCLFFSHDDEISKNKERIVTDLLRTIFRIHLTAGGFYEFWPRLLKIPIKFNTIMSMMMHSRDKNKYSDRDKWEDEICRPWKWQSMELLLQYSHTTICLSTFNKIN